MIEVADTTDWPLAKILPFVGDVIASFQRLSERFPDDTSPAWLWNEWISNRRKLWLVLEDGRFRAAVMTCISVLQSSGKTEATLLDLAGDGVADYADILNGTLEEWATRQGAHVMTVIGREGWKPLLRKYGYRPAVVHYRKEMNHGQL